MKLRLPKQLCAALVAATLLPTAMATTLSDATLSIDSFDTATIGKLKDAGWTFANVSGTNDGFFTTGSSAGVITPASGTDLTTNVISGGNRWTWSGIVTVKISSLKNAELLHGGTGATGASAGIGLGVTGVADNQSAAKVTGTWQNNAYQNTTSTEFNPSDYDNGDGTITLGVIFNGGNGTTVYVGNNVSKGDGGLRWNTNTEHVYLSGTSGIIYESLYWFDKALTADEMKAAMAQTGTNTLTWLGEGERATWNATDAMWLDGEESVAFTTSTGTKRNTVVFGAEGVKNIDVVGDVQTAAGVRVDSGNYSFTVKDNATLKLNQLTVANGATAAFATEGSGSLELDGTIGGQITLTNGAVVKDYAYVTSGKLELGADSAIVVQNGGVLNVAATQNGRESYVHGAVEVQNGGKLILRGKDATGYNGGANSMKKITIAEGGKLVFDFNNNDNETFAGTLILDGSIENHNTAYYSRLDMFGGSAKIQVSDNKQASLSSGVMLNLRQNNTELNIGSGASLTLNRGLKGEGTEGNDIINKTGNGNLIIKNTVDIKGITLYDGTITFEGNGSIGAITTNEHSSRDYFDRHMLVKEGVTLSATSLTNSWSMGTITVNGTLNFSGEVSTSAGGNGGRETDNLITGTGSVTAASLTVGNVSSANIGVKNFTVTGTSSIGGNGLHVLDGATLNMQGGATISNTLSIRGGSVNLTGNVNNALNGTIEFTKAGSALTFSSGDQKLNTLDFSKGHAAGGTVTIAGDAHVTANNMWQNESVAIKLNQGGSLATGNIVITGLKGGGAIASASTSSDNNDKYGIGNTMYTLSGVGISYAGGSDITLANKLNGVSLTNDSTHAMTATNVQAVANALRDVNVNQGNITIKNLSAQVTYELNNLVMAGSKTAAFYTDANGTNEGNIAVSGTLTAGNGATLNANLTMKGGSTIAVSGENGLHMGSSVTLEQGNGKINLSDNIINGLNSLTVGEGLTLFSGVDAFNINGATYDAGTTYKAGDFFNLSNSDVAVTRPWDFVVKYTANAASDGGVVSLWMETPEPATATLSLLALAALAARRKRK